MGSTMGAIGGGAKSLFSNGGDEVKGTGQSVGDLKKIGYSPEDIGAMGGGAPSKRVGFGRDLLRGILGAGGSAMQQRAANPTYQPAQGYNPLNFYGG